MKQFTTVNGQFESLTVIERSKFICNIKGVKDEDDAKHFVASIKKKHSLATHNCYCYIADNLGLVQKFSDDGEPQSTAGLPMLDVLKNKKIYKTVAVVTRYFGGVKLGTGGLVRAYSGAVIDCLSKCDIVTYHKAHFVSVSVDYEQYAKFQNLVLENTKVINTEFDQNVNISLVVKDGFLEQVSDKIKDFYCGKVACVVNKVDYYGF